jgi:hypothetical protein
MSILWVVGSVQVAAAVISAAYPLQQLSNIAAAGTGMQVLSLAYNKLTGVLPAQWKLAGSPFKGLSQLLLHVNRLQGAIPVEWSATDAFSGLNRFTVWNNYNICGPHPAAVSGMAKYCLDTTGTHIGEWLFYW